jgi:hypothetical protein
MTKNEQMKLAIRVAYNQLEIAIKEGREAGLSPRLLVRAHFHGEPIFIEPRFAKEALVAAGPEWEYQIFGTEQGSPFCWKWLPFNSEHLSSEEIQELLDEGIIRKVLRVKAPADIKKFENDFAGLQPTYMVVDDTEDEELTPAQKANIERFHYQNLRGKSDG